MQISTLILFATILQEVRTFRHGKAERICRREDYNPCWNEEEFIQSAKEYKCITIKSTRSMTNPDALSLCEKNGTDLLEIHSAYFQKSLLDHLPNNSRSYWLGIRRTGGFLVWNSYHKMNYMRNKLDVNDEKECLVINSDTGKWEARQCSSRAYVICQSGAHDGDRPQVSLLPDAGWNIFNVNGHLKATCEASVPHHWTLGFVLTSESGDWDGGEPAYFSKDHAHVRWREEYKHTNIKCERRLTLSLRLPITRPISDSKPVLWCSRHLLREKSYQCTDLLTCSNRIHPRIQYLNTVPELNVFAHGQGPVAYIGRTLVSQCSACIGERGNLSWTVSRGSHTRPLSWDDPRVTYTQEMTTCGIQVTSYLKLFLEIKRKALEITCASYMVKGRNRQKFHFLHSTSSVLVEFGPSPPQMYVDYHGSGSLVIPGWNLSANCSACVGESGRDVYWSFLDDTGVAIRRDRWTSLEIWISSSGEVSGESCGVHIDSVFVVKVTTELRHFRLTCSSNNDSLGTADPDFTNVSRPFRFPGFWNGDYRGRGGKWVDVLGIMYELIGLLCVIVILLLIRRCVFGDEKPKTPIPIRKKRPWLKGSRTNSPKPPTKNTGPDTCVDTGFKGHKMPRNSKELADMLNISVSEASRRRKLIVQRAVEALKTKESLKRKGRNMGGKKLAGSHQNKTLRMKMHSSSPQQLQQQQGRFKGARSKSAGSSVDSPIPDITEWESYDLSLEETDNPPVTQYPWRFSPLAVVRAQHTSGVAPSFGQSKY